MRAERELKFIEDYLDDCPSSHFFIGCSHEEKITQISKLTWAQDLRKAERSREYQAHPGWKKLDTDLKKFLSTEDAARELLKILEEKKLTLRKAEQILDSYKSFSKPVPDKSRKPRKPRKPKSSETPKQRRQDRQRKMEEKVLTRRGKWPALSMSPSLPPSPGQNPVSPPTIYSISPSHSTPTPSITVLAPVPAPAPAPLPRETITEFEEKVLILKRLATELETISARNNACFLTTDDLQKLSHHHTAWKNLFCGAIHTNSLNCALALKKVFDLQAKRPDDKKAINSAKLEARSLFSNFLEKRLGTSDEALTLKEEKYNEFSHLLKL